MATSVRRGSSGLDEAESHYCDLSGRGLTSTQIDRTLRVFATADTIDLSNNEIEKIPLSLPVGVVTLDISFNAIASIQGIERLKFVQELHLAFNRLNDVTALEFCPRLVRVNLSGNRLMTTKGIETLELLESLDVSDNLIESPEALRALSLNQNLTQLTIRGNPLSQKPGYHVPMLDMIPSLLMLDDKKMRSTTKYKTKDVSAIKSLSYSRIYDEKKQFVIHKQTRPRPATTVQPLLPGDSASRYNSTMFLPPPIEPTHERARAGLQRYQEDAAPISPPAAPFSKTPLSPSKRRAPPYLSMYDRLARSNGISAKRPISPTVKPILDPNPVATKPPATAALARPQSADQNAAARFQKSVAKQTTEGARGASAPRHSTASRSTVTHQDCWQEPQQQQRRASNARRSSVRADAPAPSLDDKQKNVLSVIQNLIQHKRQTLATLRTQKPGGTPPQSREYNFQSSVTDRTGVLSK